MGFPLIHAGPQYGSEWQRWAQENNRALEIHLIRMDARMVKLTSSGTIDPALLPPPFPAMATAYSGGHYTPAGTSADLVRIPYFTTTGSSLGAAASSFTLSLFNDPDAATWRTTLGAQPLDATLTALAAADWVANGLPIGSGANTVAQVTFAANTFPGRSSSGNLVAKTITDFGFSILDDADAAAVRTTISAQPLDATLTALAGANWQNLSLAIGTGSDTCTQLVLTAGSIPAVDSGGSAFAASASDFTLTSLLVQNSAAGWRSGIGGSTVGQAFFTAANPSAIRWPRVNADNSITFRSAADTVTDIGLQADSAYVHIAGPETVTGAKTFDGAFVFNEPGANVDARFEGDTDANLLFTDASADAVGIGTNAPLSKLQVTRTLTALPTTGGYAQIEATGTTGTQRLALGVLTSTDGGLVAGTGVIQALVNASAFTNLVISPLGGNTGFGLGTVVPTATIDNGGSLAESSVISPAQITANTDNYAPTGFASAKVLRLSTDASRNITGIAGGSAGRRITICNVGAQNLVFIHNATSTAANQFLCPSSGAFTLNANDAIDLWYDGTSSRWRLIAF